MKKVLIAVLCAVVVIISSFFYWMYSHRAVPILMYHSFDASEKGKGLLFVSPHHFEQQMAFLKKNGYQVIPLDELVDSLKAGKKFPHNAVVITIDDGYQSNYSYAYPILKKYGFPATIFLATSFMGTKKTYLTWDEIKEMAPNGITFGAHTKNHVHLPSITDRNILWDEIAGSKEVIEKQLGSPVMFFAYPTGGCTEEVKELVRKAGFRAACVIHDGHHMVSRKDFYELDRVSIRDTDVGGKFAVKLSGYYNFFRNGQWRHIME